MNIERVQVGLLNSAIYNPRKDLQPSDAEYIKLKNSIEHFGYVDPIIVNKRNNVVVGGHQRLKVLRDLGYEEIEVVYVDLSDTDEKALNIALNKISGDWDAEKLEELIREIKLDTDFDLELTGFDFDEIETLFNGSLDDIEDEDFIAKKKSKEQLEEEKLDNLAELEEKIKNVQAKKGQLYKLGNHYLMCGDSTSKEDIKKLVGKNKIKLLLTDPPYGVSIVNNNNIGGSAPPSDKSFLNKGTIGGSVLVGAGVYIPVKGDETTDTARTNYEIVKDITDNQIIFGGNYFTDFLPPKAGWIVWYKHTTMQIGDCELAWSSYDKHIKLYDYLWNGLCRAGNKKDELKKRVHPTQKPVGMLCMILEDFTEENDTVLDCFGGSGSTLIACEKLNRQCFMMEYEPYYIDVIIKRWEEYTGKKAMKIIKEES